MPIPVLVVAPLAELPVLAGAIKKRTELATVAVDGVAAALKSVSLRTPAVVLLRPGLSDGDPIDLIRRLREMPATEDARILLLLDESQLGVSTRRSGAETDEREVGVSTRLSPAPGASAPSTPSEEIGPSTRESLLSGSLSTPLVLRTAGFEAGADEVVWLPADLERLAERVAAAEDGEYRRVGRAPFAAVVQLLIPGGAARVLATDSLSHLSLRVAWNESPPGRLVLPVEIPLPGVGRRALWCRIEDLATLRGIPQGLVLRFLGLTPAERQELRDVTADLQQNRRSAGPLESPQGLARFERPSEEIRYVPVLPVGGAAPARSRRTMLGVGVGVGLLAACGSAFVSYRLSHPSSQRVKNPALVVEGLALKTVVANGGTLIAIADGTWNDLDASERDSALRALYAVARERGQVRLEVFSAKGMAAVVTTDGGGTVVISP